MDNNVISTSFSGCFVRAQQSPQRPAHDTPPPPPLQTIDPLLGHVSGHPVHVVLLELYIAQHDRGSAILHIRTALTKPLEQTCPLPAPIPFRGLRLRAVGALPDHERRGKSESASAPPSPSTRGSRSAPSQTGVGVASDLSSYRPASGWRLLPPPPPSLPPPPPPLPPPPTPPPDTRPHGRRRRKERQRDSRCKPSARAMP